MNEHRTAPHLGGPVEMPCEIYWGGDVTRPFVVFCLHSDSREKGDEAQRIEMLAVSPSLISPNANFLCASLQLRALGNGEVVEACSVRNAVGNAP